MSFFIFLKFFFFFIKKKIIKIFYFFFNLLIIMEADLESADFQIKHFKFNFKLTLHSGCIDLVSQCRPCYP